MPVEIQSLSVPPRRSRRTTSGVDYSRIAMMLAVIQSRLGIAFEKQDIFVSTVGGARAPEPASDLAVALSCIICFRFAARPRSSSYWRSIFDWRAAPGDWPATAIKRSRQIRIPNCLDSGRHRKNSYSAGYGFTAHR